MHTSYLCRISGDVVAQCRRDLVSNGAAAGDCQANGYFSEVAPAEHALSVRLRVRRLVPEGATHHGK